ncbi:phage tail protein [Symbiopectobacterium sp.]|uniref:phage tail protein n=1 Tax=Symbiopectobacterium sp. TaxID=2952789 RepID=UPI003F3335ED
MFGYDTNTQGQLVSGAGESGLKFRRKGGGGWLAWTTLLDQETAQTVTAIKTHTAAVVTTNAVAFRGTLTNGQVRNLAHINSEDIGHLGDGAVPTTIHGSAMPLIQIGAGASYPILASGFNAVADANGLWKTPESAELTPSSIGALSVDELAGIPLPFPNAVAPTGWLNCNGQAFDKTLYPVLAARYPTGKLPDLRGEFIRGWDDGRKVDTGRKLLSAQGDAIRNITGKFANNGLAWAEGASSSVGEGAFTRLEGRVTSNNYFGDAGCQYELDISKVVPTANENRPRNIAFNYIVRAA